MIGPDLFTQVINQYFPEPHGSLMNGILFGVDLKASGEFYDQLQRIGLLHLVVLSGINITLLGAMVSHATKAFSKKASACITIVVIVVFIFFVGPDPPIVRAGIMGILTLISIIYERKGFALYTLFLSAVIMIALKPEWLGTISFQLSTGATLGIILFGPKMEEVTGTARQRLFQSIKQDLKTTMSAQVLTVPIIFFYFKQFSLISPLANMAISFFVPSLMIFGFATAFLGSINHYAGLIPAYLSHGILNYMVYMIKLLALVPYGFFDFS